jgi:hypothetical protein
MKLSPTFNGCYEQHRERHNEPFTLLRVIDAADEHHDEEVLPMYEIQFSTDGVIIEAWPEEVLTPTSETRNQDLSLQELIDSGLAWQLEGHIGRQAMACIESGLCTLGPEGHHDYWGNYVPSRTEVQPGTVGSPEYAQQKQEQS